MGTNIFKCDSKIVGEVLDLATLRLKDEWILLGGTVLPALGIDHRTTYDIDLVSKGNSTQEDALILMDIAESLGLPVETINQAGAHYLKKIKGYDNALILLRDTPTTKIYRPNLYLYTKLKLGRLSEGDLKDCIEYSKYCMTHKEPLPTRQIFDAIEEEARLTASKEKKKNLATLEAHVKAIVRTRE